MRKRRVRERGVPERFQKAMGVWGCMRQVRRRRVYHIVFQL